MKSSPSKQKIKSFTLIEVMVAVFIFSAGIIGVYKLMPSLISGVSINSSQITAAYLAQEGIEIVRNVRDTNWLKVYYAGGAHQWYDGLTSCQNGCEVDYFCTTIANPKPVNPHGHNCFGAYSPSHYLKLDPTYFYNYYVGSNTKFTRKIVITPDPSNPSNPDFLTVSATVFWQDRGKNYQFSAEEKLYKWQLY